MRKRGFMIREGIASLIGDDNMKLLIRSAEIKPKIKILLWGLPGSGKTHFGLSSPKPLGIDTERGCEAFFNRFEFDLLSLPTIDQFELAVKTLQEGSYENYESLVIDSLTGLEELYVEKYTRGERTSLAEWGVIKPKLDKLMKRIVSLPLNLICTARSQNMWDTREFKLIGQRPHIQKNLSAYYFDIIGKLERRNGQAPTIVLNKSRFVLPPKIEGISFEELQSLIYNEMDIKSGNNIG